MKPGIYDKLDFQTNRRAISRSTKFVFDQASGGVSRIIPVRVIDQFETKKATVGFVHSEAYGHMLLIDSEIQLAELDEHIYHESLVHAGLAAISARSSSALDVLVLGGGDGCALREIFKWSNIRQVTLVDHDPRIRLFFRKPHVNKVFGSAAALSDNRVNYQAFDAQHFLKVSEAVWDLVIVDLPDFESSVADLLEIMLTRRTKGVGVIAANLGTRTVPQSRLLPCSNRPIGLLSKRLPMLSFGDNSLLALFVCGRGVSHLRTRKIDRLLPTCRSDPLADWRRI